MSLGTILLIVLILMLIGVIPTWPHSKSWGYAPSGVLGLVVLIILVLLLMALAEFIGSRDKVSGSVYIALLLAFAVMPRLRLPRLRLARYQPDERVPP